MRKLISIFAALMISGAGMASAKDAPIETAEELKAAFEQLQTPSQALNQSNAVHFAQSCCKRCNKGKACGDSCISRKKNCNKGKGCAC